MDIIGMYMKIYFYKSGSGKSPIQRFIDKLPKEDQARFLEVIDEVETYGFSAARVIFKPIEGKLWEIKFRSTKSGYRIFYVLLEKDLMVWLHAFSKKAQKTPQKELELARKRMKEVM
jgi:phage-related protein